MIDIVDAPTRSLMMAGIRGRDTRPERLVRSSMHRAGYRFRLNVRSLPGSPDLVLPRHRICIFVHGCFWHQHPGCQQAKMPKTRPEFWRAKLERNRARDEAVIQQLVMLEWRVLVIWECRLRRKKDLDALPREFGDWLAAGSRSGEFSAAPTA